MADDRHVFGPLWMPVTMEYFNNYVLSHSVIELVAVMFLIAGFMTFVTGVCLLVGCGETLRFFDELNRRVFALRSMKSIADSRDVQHIEQRHLRWIGLAFIAGAAYALHGLITGFGTAALLHMFGVKPEIFSPAFWVVECVRWLLIAGNLLAIAAGFMLGIFPRAFFFLEARDGPWFSVQRAAQGPDKKNFTLDGWVAEFPHSVAWIIIVAGLVPMGDFGAMLYGIR